MQLWLLREDILISMYNLTSVSDVRFLLDQIGIKPKAGLGQNFLIDNNVVSNIVRTVIEGGPYALEIGPGLGVLTSKMGDLKELVCIETDKDMLKCLNVTCEGMDNMSIINEDFLKVDLSKILKKDRLYMAYGNLPYYITTPIIIKLLENRQYFNSIVMMVQKEVGDRIKALPGSKDYGALSVLVQYHGKVETVCSVSKNCFYPAPQVSSVVIKIELYDKPLFEVNEKLYFNVVRAAFGKRRKTLLNALSNSEFLDFSKEEVKKGLEIACIDPSLRGETLSLEDFKKICNSFGKL